MATAYKREIHCSFCSKGTKEGLVLVIGPAVAMCEQCVELSVAIIAEEKAKRGPSLIMATANFPCGSMGEEVAA